MDKDLANSINGQLIAARMGLPFQVKKDKDRYDKALDKSLEQHLEKQEIAPDQLLSIQQKRHQLQAQLSSLLENSGIDKILLNAIQTLLGQGKAYLQEEDFEAMKLNFMQAQALLEKLDLEQRLELNFDQILDIKAGTIESIFKVAVVLFKEGQNDKSFSLFSLLTILQPNQYDYWYRTAILAQTSGNLDLALQAYEQAIELNDQLIEAYLFCAECYLKKGAVSEAKEALERAEALIKSISAPDDVIEMAKQIKLMFQ